MFLYCLCAFLHNLMLMYTCLCMCGGIMHVYAQPHVCVCLLMRAHVAVHVQMVCMTTCVTKRRYIIVSCQGDIARELELLTHMDITVCQVTAWTIRVSLQTSLALINYNAC